MWQPHLNLKKTFISCTGKEGELESSVQKCFNQLAYYVAYIVTNAFYSAVKFAKGAGVCLQKVLLLRPVQR